jgi:23S rRNA (adenine-N6)-dimethyltransferase
VAARPSRAPRPRGRHLLRSGRLAELIVSDAEVAAGDLVLDLGAGTGMLTRALARAGARVVAVELDARLARDLRRIEGAVEVVAGDARTVAWPSEPFRVVANLPFAHGTEILRRLLGDPGVPLTQLDAIVEWGLAAKRTAIWPSTLLGCSWGAWYELSLVRRVPRACFAPPPGVDGAVLRAVRRPGPLVAPEEAPEYGALLRRAFGARTSLDRILPRSVVHRIAHELGFDPHAAARDLDARQWARLYAAVKFATSRRRAGGSRRRRGSRR